MNVRETSSYKQRLTDGTTGDVSVIGRRREHWVKNAAGWKLRLTDDIDTKQLITFNGKRIDLKNFAKVPVAYTQSQTPSPEDAALLNGGRGLVVVCRVPDGAFLIKLPVYRDDDRIAKLSGGGSYVKLPLAPGKYTLRSDKEPAETIEIEAGRVYYFEVKLKTGLPRGRGRLMRDTGALGEQVYRLPQLMKMKLVEPEE